MTAYLVAELVLHVLLDPTQHEGLEDHVQTSQLVFVHGSLVVRVVLDVLRKPLAKLVVRIEELGHDEMKERPKLCKQSGSATRSEHVRARMSGEAHLAWSSGSGCP